MMKGWSKNVLEPINTILVFEELIFRPEKLEKKILWYLKMQIKIQMNPLGSMRCHRYLHIVIFCVPCHLWQYLLYNHDCKDFSTYNEKIWCNRVTLSASLLYVKLIWEKTWNILQLFKRQNIKNKTIFSPIHLPLRKPDCVSEIIWSKVSLILWLRHLETILCRTFKKVIGRHF